MSRVETDATWTLFDPYDARLLTEVYGKEFEVEYERLEEEFRNNPENFNPNTVVIKANDLMRALVISYNNEGGPFWMFKDTTNRNNPHKELGIIRSLNLCQEMAQPTDDEHTAVCNLGSVNLARVNTEKDIRRVVRLGTRMLDNTIDLTNYPSEKSKRTQEDRRAIGIGMLGEAEMLANMKIHYGSDEHLELIDNIYRIVNEESIEASKDLANEKGSCIIEGTRNAYRLCVAPNSTSGIFAGTTNSHELVYNRIWMEDNMLGVFKMTAPNLNVENYQFYKNPYEVDIYKQLDATAVKQKHLDMTISQNIYLDPVGLKASKIKSVILYAWKKGLCSLYYLRSKPPKTNIAKDDEIACFGCNN